MVTSVHVPWHVPNQARPYLFLPCPSISQSHQACSRKHEVYRGYVAQSVGMGSCHVIVGLCETFVGACLCLPLPASACLCLPLTFTWQQVYRSTPVQRSRARKEGRKEGRTAARRGQRCSSPPISRLAAAVCMQVMWWRDSSRARTVVQRCTRQVGRGAEHYQYTTYVNTRDITSIQIVTRGSHVVPHRTTDLAQWCLRAQC